MAETDIIGTYVFHLEGIMYANSLRGGKFHPPPTYKVVAGQLLSDQEWVPPLQRYEEIGSPLERTVHGEFEIMRLLACEITHDNVHAMRRR